MTDEYEEHLRIKAIIEEQQRLLRENPKLKGKTDAQLWGNELRSRATKAQMDDPEFRSVWDEKQKVGSQKRSDNAEWHKNRNLALQKVYDTAEWREKQKAGVKKATDTAEWKANHKAGVKKTTDTAEWRENVTVANRKKADTVEWRENHKAGCRIRSDTVEWRENHKLQLEKMHSDPNIIENRRVATKKANSKPISCDGIIFPSKAEAYHTLAPATRLTDKSKKQWLDNQMKKYPDRFFNV